MFEINEYIMYGESGVCVVSDIGTPPISGVDKSRKYYILHPLYSAGRTIYTPVDNDKVCMRKILTDEEAEELINKIPEIETIWVSNEKFREENYKRAMRSYSCEEWIKIIKTLYLRKQERKAEGKSITTTDERYRKAAESCLYGELSLALGIAKEEVESYIARKVKKLEMAKVLGYEESEEN